MANILVNGLSGDWEFPESHFRKGRRFSISRTLTYGFKMKLSEHLSIINEALKRWCIALLCDALGVGLLWLIGLLLLRVPLAPLWALLAALFQLIPAIGILFSPIGPAVAAAIGGGIARMFYVLILCAVIVMMDGFVLQPLLMKRSARVPIWASIATPFVLGSLLSFWGVVLSAPLLAVIYAYREHHRRVGQRLFFRDPDSR